MPQYFSKVEHEKQIDSPCSPESATAKIEEPVEENRVVKIFNGQVILVTGGTGYLGKVFLEKLLRVCTGIKKLYVLVRGKKGKTAQERLNEVLENELFDLLKSYPIGREALEKIEAISGDVMLPELGISPEDKKRIIEEVTILYHGAATVRFDEELYTSILVNTRGTKRVLELAKQCKKLELFAHISTAYCHPQYPLLKEQPYDPPADPEKMITACEILDEATIKRIEKQLLGKIPNAYTFTKSMSEHLVVQSFSELPAVIYRPSIVIPVWKSPIPGWTDNYNGPIGLLHAAGKGVLRTMYCDISNSGDYVSADFVCDAMLIATWNTLRTKDFSKRVIHMTSASDLKVSWGELIQHCRYVAEYRVPLNGIAWYPGGSTTTNKYYHKFCLIFFMWLPSILGDIIIWCFRYPPVLCRVQRKLSKGMVVLEYYCNNQWKFENAEARSYRKILNKCEKEAFIVEAHAVDPVKYLESCFYCFRRFILKTPDEMLPAAKLQMRLMCYLDRTIKFLFNVWVLYFVYCKFIYPFVPHDDSSDVIVEEIINGTL